MAKRPDIRAVIDVSKGSPDRFGYSWDRFNELSPKQEEQFRRWTSPISPESGWQGARFLDAGCGTGRNAYWAMSYGAESCVAMDIDARSLDAARRNLTPYPKAEIANCSIYEIPYENEFDIVLSIGVIQHLEFPERGVAELVKAVKHGGRVLIWVYGYENMEFYVKIAGPLRRCLFSRMNLPLVRFFALAPTALLWVLIHTGLMRLEYFRFMKDAPFAHLHSIVFDQMLPKIVHFWRREEAAALLEVAGLEEVRADWVNEMSWVVTGIKPGS